MRRPRIACAFYTAKDMTVSKDMNSQKVVIERSCYLVQFFGFCVNTGVIMQFGGNYNRFLC